MPQLRHWLELFVLGLPLVECEAHAGRQLNLREVLSHRVSPMFLALVKLMELKMVCHGIRVQGSMRKARISSLNVSSSARYRDVRGTDLMNCRTLVMCLV